MKRLFVLLACLLAIPAQGQILSIIMGGTNQPAATPTFSPAAGAVANPTTVTASTSTSDGCTIYFDTSNPPVTAQTTYSVTIGVTLYAQARGCAHHRDSAVGSAAYTISAAQSFSYVAGGPSSALNNYCSSASLCALTSSVTPNLGDEVIVCAVQVTGQTSVTLTGMGSNLVVAASSNPVNSYGGGNIQINCWYVLAALHSAITPQVNVNAGSGVEIFYLETSSTLSASHDTDAGNGGYGSTLSTTAVSTAGNNELMISIFDSRNGGAPGSLSGGSPNAWVGPGGTNQYAELFYQLNAAQVTSQQYSLTATGSTEWATQILVLK